jgi:hypothetical protein
MATQTEERTGLETERKRENEEATDPERELEEETPTASPPEHYDDDGNYIGPPEAATAEPPDGKIFDDTDYEREDLALPKIDGQGVDRIAVKFSGTVFLDRSDPADVDLVRRLKLGQDATLLVEGKVSAKSYKGATDREGDLDVVVEELGIKVTTVYRPAAEEL